MDKDLRTSVERMVKDFIHKYVNATDEVVDVMAEYAMRTWQEPGQSVRYLLIKGARGSGKTRAGQVMQAICRKAAWVSDFSSMASLMEVMSMEQDSHPLTVIVDDLMAIKGLESFLLCGADRSHRIAKMVKAPNGHVMKSYNVFGHKVLLVDEHNKSRILKDPSLLSKCMPIRLDLDRDLVMPSMIDFSADKQVVERALYCLAFVNAGCMVAQA